MSHNVLLILVIATVLLRTCTETLCKSRLNYKLVKIIIIRLINYYIAYRLKPVYPLKQCDRKSANS